MGRARKIARFPPAPPASPMAQNTSLMANAIRALAMDAVHTYAYTAFAGLGVILSAVYLLWMYQRVMFGPPREDGLYGGHVLSDITRREVATLVPIVIFV